MVVEDQADRENRAGQLARLAIGRSRLFAHRLITLKTFHDPAIVRGFLAENFTLAEIGASFTGQIPEEAIPTECPPGFAIMEGAEASEMATETALAMGDFFYDGHWRHDTFPGVDAARRLWSKIAADDLNGAADPALILWDQRRGRPAAICTVRVTGRSASLSIVAVAAHSRGGGLGRVILREALNRLVNKAQEIRVETASYNLPALSLYHRLGFTPTSPLLALHYHSPNS
jgi:ribosomal protein S18 acetylase RimI-like enzyme